MTTAEVCILAMSVAIVAGFLIGLWAFFFALAGVLFVWVVIDDPRGDESW